MRSSMRLAAASPSHMATTATLLTDSTGPALHADGILRLIRLWISRRRERMALAELNDMDALSKHILRDLGLTRSEARAEFSKPFWRA